MQTAMSTALVRAGLATEEQAEKATYLPRHMRPFQRQIEEISRLVGLMKSNNIGMTCEDKIAYLVYASDLDRGLYSEAFGSMLKHLKFRVAELELA